MNFLGVFGQSLLATFQAMSVALRYRLPIRIAAGAVAECNRDFLNRMLLNPSGGFVKEAP